MAINSDRHGLTEAQIEEMTASAQRNEAADARLRSLADKRVQFDAYTKQLRHKLLTDNARKSDSAEQKAARAAVIKELDAAVKWLLDSESSTTNSSGDEKEAKAAEDRLEERRAALLSKLNELVPTVNGDDEEGEGDAEGDEAEAEDESKAAPAAATAATSPVSGDMD